MNVHVPFFPAEKMVLLRWCVECGARVEKGQVICDVRVFEQAGSSCEEVTIELQTPETGRITLIASPGSELDFDVPIATIVCNTG